MLGVFLIGVILYGELERGGSYDNEGGVEGGENFF